MAKLEIQNIPNINSINPYQSGTKPNLVAKI